MTAVYIVGGSLLFLAALTITLLLWCFRQAFYQPKSKKNIDPRALLLKGEREEGFRREIYDMIDEAEVTACEAVTIESRDGLRLFGRLYAGERRDVVEIFFHGWRGSAFRDGCGAARYARERGHTLLLVDQRAHGESDGQVITFGIKEKYDCLDWINYLIGRFGPEVKILLKGISMGASTVLMAASLPLPPNVCGMVADCGYSTPEAIIRKVCRDMGITDRIGYPLVSLSARLFGGFRLKDGGALAAVADTDIPILLVHGTGDDFVPFSMCREIAAACRHTPVVVEIADASHGLAWFYDRKSYSDAVSRFYTAVLGGKKKETVEG